MNIAVIKNSDCNAEMTQRINLANQRVRMSKTQWSSRVAYHYQDHCASVTCLDVQLSRVFSYLFYTAEM